MALPRVHFVNRFFYPDFSATSQMLSGIAFGLAAEGHDVQITTSRQLYEDASAELASTETVHGVTIHRVATTRFGRSGLGGRAVDYASFYAATAWHLLRYVRRGDIIVAKTDPPMLSVVTSLVGRARGATCVNWLQDLFPEVASSVKLGGRGGQIAFAALRIIRNWSLQRAQRNVVIGERMAEYLLAAGIAPAKVAAIPNWADPTIVYPITHSSLRREWGLEGKIVVGYSGNLGRAHEIATFVDAIKDIQDRSGDAVARDIVFVFVGSGALRRALEADIAANSLSNVRFFPYQPIERLAETLAVPDIHLVSLRPELEGFVVPSKIYGVMAAARPAIFIGAEDGEVARLIQHHETGAVVPVGDGEALAEAIMALARDETKRCRMGANARDVFEARFTKAASIAAWDRLLTTMTGREAVPEQAKEERLRDRGANASPNL